ncbi:hypothetical protein RCL1_001773 [Eukaryota sp. TZLM3-RCL]
MPPKPPPTARAPPGVKRGAPAKPKASTGPSKAQMLAVVEERRKRQEEERQAEEEARRLEEEALKREEEAKRAAELLKTQKKEAKKAKVQELKQKGLYKSAKELEKERILAERRKMLLAAMASTAEQLQQRATTSQNNKPVEEQESESSSELEDWEDMTDSSSCSEDSSSSLSEAEEVVVTSEENNLPPDFQPLSEKQYKKLLKGRGVKGRAEIDRYHTHLELYNEKMEAERNKRSPIGCILGHVDCGKTKLLDKIRETNVQEGEAGGITQQIGATFFPMPRIAEKCAELAIFKELETTLPGLLVIDTPGHESFTNLRSRGSSLCDIAILVVDLMHGLQAQTRESIELLKQRKTPFVIALNKVDRLYTWQTNPNSPIRDSFAKQNRDVHSEFEKRWTEIRGLLAGEGFNTALYWENPDERRYVNVIPTSAITGEGIPDLLYMVIKLTQQRMSKKLALLSELECTILEVKSVEGLGTTIDVILSNGVLHVGDTIVCCGMNGPITTTVRALLTPQPMKELRVKTPYMKNDEVRAALGLKIYATELEGAIAGSRVLVAGPEDDIDDLEEEVMQDLTKLLESVKTVDRGVYVQASTLGSLEALMTFLKDQVPVAGVSIGPIHKKDVMRAGIMIERNLPQYGVILAFDVKTTIEAERMADELGVKIISADIIYHLTDALSQYFEEVKRADREKASEVVVFPVKLSIVKGCVFNASNPIIVGCRVDVGTLRLGTPIFVPKRNNLLLGRVVSMEINHKAVTTAATGVELAVRIQPFPGQPIKSCGKHFYDTDELCSRITRDSIDALKTNFREELTPEVVTLVQQLKKCLDIL